MGAGTSQSAPGPQVSPAGPNGRTRLRAKTACHAWRWKAEKWVCLNCLKISRASVPNRSQKCAGFSERFRELIANPRGHSLCFAPHTDGVGMTVCCSRCGHFASGNRRVALHAADCRGVRASDGAIKAWERFANRQSPAYKDGPGKCLEAYMTLEQLLALSPQSAASQPSQSQDR